MSLKTLITWTWLAIRALLLQAIAPSHRPTMPHAVNTWSPTKQYVHSLPLFVNDGQLEKTQIGELRPTTLDLPIEELRERFDQDGYLFVKGLLPRAAVLEARKQYFNFLQPTGVLKPGTQPVEGIFDDAKDRAQFPGIGAGAAGGNGHPGEYAAVFVDRALEAHYQKWYYEDFCKHPALKDFVTRLTGWGENTKAFERTLLRNNVPGNKAIGVHYDQ
ncbi:hypothetical protein N0V83_007729 [Neocucurbitaria cava]|uniref:Phytanoyl-CoA dioxygenase n=1 Tax=Neocucurbitaria cava TaxID=798079 RepID=A0A9W8Y6G6_9PLEO|nr:hypothetical protein N0V83_007729 [Neocucurbitaria cava]